ncbi:MAG: hypothetical protein JWP44_2212 [Mucilaginibacter sp.]|nr:hypothetical protein [Mucilaginibacter sp.]
MSLSQESKKHLLFIDSLRALAAIYVVIHHASLQYYDFDSDLKGARRVSIKLLEYGHSAVDLFIVLSGFSLMLSVTKNNHRLKGGILLFLKRRAIRILPTYYFAMALSLLLIWLFIGEKTGTHWDAALPVTFNSIITHLFLVHDFFSSTFARINHSFWSISVEFRIYLLFPLLIWLWRKYSPLFALLTAVVLSFIGLGMLLTWHSYYPDIMLNSAGVTPYLISFTLGMMATDLSFSTSARAIKARKYYADSTLMKRAIITAIYLVAFVLFRLLVKLPFLREENVHRHLQDDVNDIFLGVLFATILFIFSIAKPSDKLAYQVVKMLNWPPLVFTGTFSYSIYLVHAPLLQLLSQYVLLPLHIDAFYSCWLLILLGTPLIILFSYFFFTLFERQFLTMRKKESLVALELDAVNNPAP